MHRSARLPLVRPETYSDLHHFETVDLGDFDVVRVVDAELVSGDVVRWVGGQHRVDVRSRPARSPLSIAQAIIIRALRSELIIGPTPHVSQPLAARRVASPMRWPAHRGRAHPGLRDRQLSKRASGYVISRRLQGSSVILAAGCESAPHRPFSWSGLQRERSWGRPVQMEISRRCADTAGPAQIAATRSLTGCARPVGTPRPAIRGTLGPIA
jgi:hypothetical protein